MAFQTDSDTQTLPKSQVDKNTHRNHQFQNQGPRAGEEKNQSSSIVLLMANALDCEFFNRQFSRRGGTHVLDALHNVQLGLRRIGMHRPQVLIYDPKFHLRSVKSVLGFVESGIVGNLIILDDRVREGLLLKALVTPRTSYLTRQLDFSAILAAVLSVAENNERMFDPDIEQRLIREPGGLRLFSPPGSASLALLTPRELDVLKLVAMGYKVRDCARFLKVSASTIDNHKARLMKKLKIHKVPGLTRLAIREGLISA